MPAPFLLPLTLVSVTQPDPGNDPPAAAFAWIW